MCKMQQIITEILVLGKYIYANFKLLKYLNKYKIDYSKMITVGFDRVKFIMVTMLSCFNKFLQSH